MVEALFSLLAIYTFIVLGFMAKKIFKEKIDSKTLSIVNVYFFQTFIPFWGLMATPLLKEHLSTFLTYLIIVSILLIPTFFISKILFNDPKEEAIFTITGFVGNTGNLGIPLGIAFFGEGSIVYTVIINLANIVILYSIGVYLYSRGSFSVKDSLLNMVKIPMIPASIIAITLNLIGFKFDEKILNMVEMGSYTAISLQMFLLGTFLSQVKIKSLNPKLTVGTLFQKFAILPFFTALFLQFTSLSPYIQAIFLMEMMMPIAINNLNFATLYDCKPQELTSLILFSTIIFIPLIFFLDFCIKTYYLL